jgi:hypothetical protein
VTKFPRLGDILAAEEGKVDGAAGTSREVVLGPSSEPLRKPGEARGPAEDRARMCAIGQSRVSEQYRSARSRGRGPFWTLFESPIRFSISFFAQTYGSHFEPP